MNPDTNKNLNEESFDDLDTNEAPGVDDFLRELEAKERDLDISSEMVIEIAEADFDDAELPDFVLDELGSAERRDAGGTVKSTAIPGQPSYRDLENELAALPSAPISPSGSIPAPSAPWKMSSPRKISSTLPMHSACGRTTFTRSP